MAICKHCGGKSRFLENICQECLQTDPEARTTIDSQKRPLSSSKYGAARDISGICEFFGWVLVAGGVVVAFMALSNNMGALGLIAGVFVSVSGLYLVMAAQFIRASVDNADTTKEILELLRKRA